MVSATGRSILLSSRTICDVSEYDREDLIMRRPTGGRRAIKKMDLGFSTPG